MKTKHLFSVVPVCLLVFGLALAGCDNGSTASPEGIEEDLFGVWKEHDTTWLYTLYQSGVN
jgi:hypothetical protein